MKHFHLFFCALLIACSALFLTQCSSEAEDRVDLLISNALIYDGSGKNPFTGCIAITGDSIVYVGEQCDIKALREIDAMGQAVSPGFINMLSWASESLLHDPRAQSDIRQGVTLEVMGEGWSMGPLNDSMKAEILRDQGDIKYEIPWTTLGEYLQHLQTRGVSPNVASFVGATTLRIHAIGYEDRLPEMEEMEQMRVLVKQAMEEGALGVASALIYAPAFYSTTQELIELCKVATESGGMYITHMRSEGNKLLEGVNEVLEISREANIPAEIYHLKASGKSNWRKMDLVIAKIDSARNAGLKITTNMYTYIAGSTGLDAAMPPWVQEGGYQAWAERLKDPLVRTKVMSEMKMDAMDWENLYFSAGSPEKVILVGFKNDALKKYTGKTLAQVAAERGKSPEETAIDLVIEDGSRVGAVYFLMDEENVKKQIALPYMSFCSDAEAPATEGVFLKSNPHPRAYGNFARLLGKYVRDEQVIPLAEAIRKLTSLPATNLKIQRRGLLKEGYYADIVIFDPATIQDHATFDKPHQYSTGVTHVFVNGVQVLKDGEHTGATPGKFVKGPGFKQ